MDSQTLTAKQQYMLDWRARNKEKLGEYSRTYYANHPELKERGRVRAFAWASEHKEENRARASRWKKHNPDKVRAYKNVRRSRIAGGGGSFTPDEWIQLITYHGRRCPCCGRQEPEVKLTADHIVPVSKGGSSNIDNIQPLCLSCNCSKQDKSIDYRVDNSRSCNV